MAVTYRDLLDGLEITLKQQYRDEVERIDTVSECMVETMRLLLEKLAKDSRADT